MIRSSLLFVRLRRQRGDQENLLQQLKSGVQSLAAPVDNLISNWAYMVMGSLAWSLKAWAALILPEEGRWQQQHREEKQPAVADGLQQLPRGADAHPRADRLQRASHRLPAPGLEPLATRLLPLVRAVAPAAALLTFLT